MIRRRTRRAAADPPPADPAAAGKTATAGASMGGGTAHALREAVARLRTEKARLDAEMRALAGERTMLQDDLDSQTRRLAELRDHTQALQRRHAELSRLLADRRAAHQRAAAATAARLAAERTTAAAHERLAAENAQLTRELDALTQRVATARRALAEKFPHDPTRLPRRR